MRRVSLICTTLSLSSLVAPSVRSATSSSDSCRPRRSSIEKVLRGVLENISERDTLGRDVLP